MLTEWIHWISSLHSDELAALFVGAILFLDGPRYAILKLVFCLWDLTFGSARPLVRPDRPAYQPSMCVVLAGYNEADTIEATLHSIYGTYPHLEILVIDDGSKDGMYSVAQRFASTHAGVLVLRKPERGGKSSCINYALNYTRAEVIVIVDTDSHVGPGGLLEIVQPLADERVAAVSATVLARNPFTNLITWLQAQEYLHGIFVGRIVSARLGILGLASGAFAAYRRTAVERVMGWDVGPGEDGDITFRLRKAGYNVAFTPYAECYTNVPETWWGLFKQRRRWNRGAIRYKCRKHIDMAFFWTANFRLSNFCMLLNVWIFSIVCQYGFWVYFIWLLLHFNDATPKVMFAGYLTYLSLHILQVLVVLVYSRNRLRDALICAVVPIVPIYQFYNKIARVLSVTEEIVFRKSFEDNYVPPRVRAATWHW